MLNLDKNWLLLAKRMLDIGFYLSVGFFLIRYQSTLISYSEKMIVLITALTAFGKVLIPLIGVYKQIASLQIDSDTTTTLED